MHIPRLSIVLAAALTLTLVAGPALAQTTTATSGRGSAYGARLNTALGELLGPQPEVEAAFPPDDSAEDVLLEIPADPVLDSGTLSVGSQANAGPVIEATLREAIADQAGASLPQAWNARGYAIAEDLTAIEETLTADVIEGEALTSCVNGQPVHATGANLVNASLGGTGLLDGDGTGDLLEGLEITADEPNNVVFDQAGIRIVTWETNWDGAAGTTDGSGTVWVNGLHVSVDLLELDQELLPDELEGLVDQLLGGTGDDSTGGLLDEGGTDQLSGAEAQGQDAESLEAESEEQTERLDPEGPEERDADSADTLESEALEEPDAATDDSPEAEALDEPDAGTDGNVGTDGDSELPAAETLEETAADLPVAETLETDAQPAEGIQIQQDGDTIDLIVSHAESEATCGPGEDLGITKDVSSDVVAPGETFSYTITVPNQQACTIENLEVVDRIEGPTGSEVVSTTPTADDVDNLTVTWNDVGPIAPGEQATLGIDVRVPTNAPDGSVYRESVTASGECGGRPVDGGLDFEGPTVRAGEPPPPSVDDRLPRTGGGMTTSLGGLLLLAAGAGLARVARRP